jgi:hypothetical protein
MQLTLAGEDWPAEGNCWQGLADEIDEREAGECAD